MSKSSKIPVGGDLKKWCEKRGLSRRSVAVIIGCDPRTVTRLWAGNYRALTAIEWDALRAEGGVVRTVRA